MLLATLFSTPAHAEAPIEVIEPEAVETLEQYIIRRFSEENIPTHFLFDIIQAESDWYEKAYNPEAHRNWKTGEVICNGSFGLFQIGCIHNLENPNKLFDPHFNTEMAIEVYKKQGFRAWGVCTNGKVRCI